MSSALSSLRRVCLGALVALLGPGCFSEQCDYRYRCVGGGQYEWCNVGSDYEVHRKQLQCKGPNTTCVQTDEDSVQCVYAPATACEASFVDRCDGSLRVYCDERLGWVQAVDCASLGSTGCHVDGALGKAVCD
jgi:hypothetical protein